MYDEAPVGYHELDLNAKIVRVNKTEADMLGYSIHDMLGKSIFDFIAPEERKEAKKNFSQRIKEKSQKVFERKYIHKNGQEIYFNIIQRLIIDDEGRVTGIRSSLQNITERKKAEDELKESNLRLDVAIEASQIGVWELDLINDTSIRNLIHDKTFGYNKKISKWGAKIFFKHIIPEDRPSVQAAFDSAMKTGKLFYECRIVWPNKTIHWITATGRVIRDSTGEPQKMLGTITEITELKRTEEELNKYTAKLENANKELETFAYSVSHDLRTPLRAIDGFSRILLEDYPDKLDDEGKRVLSVIGKNTERMGQLIDDILSFSRMGRIEMSVAEIDMEQLARSVVDELKPMVHDRNVELIIDTLPPSQGDKSMIQVVIINLINNAIKFTRPKTAARIEIGGRSKNNENIYFVKDNGVGFDMNYQNKLFGVFQRLHGQDEFEGTGIGLAIVKQVVVRHGGRVWAEGKVDKGATIYFTLPIKKEEENEQYK